MPRLHALLAVSLVTVLGVGVGTVQARAGSASAPAHRAAVHTTAPVATPAPIVTPSPVPSLVRSPSALARPVVRYPDSLAAGWGIDVSWPQCGRPLPAVATGFAVVGVNGGRPRTANPCLRDQLHALRGRLPIAFYLNLSAPDSGDPTSYGARLVDDGLARIARTGAHVPVVWLDVEVLNQWRDSATNVAVIDGALRRLESHGIVGGVYSSVPMWQQITAGAQVHVPVWLAITGSEVPSLRHSCAVGLGGTRATMVQYVALAPAGGLIDADVLCRTDPGVLRMFGRL
jgi:hypothetical protein